MNIQCRRSSAWESTRPMWGEAEDRAVVSSNLTDGIKIYQDIHVILELELCQS